VHTVCVVLGEDGFSFPPALPTGLVLCLLSVVSVHWLPGPSRLFVRLAYGQTYECNFECNFM